MFNYMHNFFLFRQLVVKLNLGGQYSACWDYNKGKDNLFKIPHQNQKVFYFRGHRDFDGAYKKKVNLNYNIFKRPIILPLLFCNFVHKLIKML